MEKMNLVAKVREKVGKQASKQARVRGCVPAIVYGHGMKPLSVEVDMKQFLKTIHTKAGENVLIDLQVEGVKLEESTCVIKEIQHDPVTEKIDHVDFTVISMTEKIKVKVMVVLRNAQDAPGVKEGGVLELVHHEVEVECLPVDIPEHIELDVKTMKIGDTIYAKDLPVPQGVTVMLEAGEPVVGLHMAKIEEEVKPEGEEAGVQPEVIEKGKKPEEGAAAAAPAPEKGEKSAEKK